MKTLAALAIGVLALAGCGHDGPVEEADSKFLPQHPSDWHAVPGPTGELVYCYAFDAYEQMGVTCMEMNND